MKTPLRLGIVILVLWGTSEASTWLSSKDNKQVAELELMNDVELADEMDRVCGSLTSFNKTQPQIDALEDRFGGIEHKIKVGKEIREEHEYLALIGRVVRKHHGGTSPSWVEEMLHASWNTEPMACLEIWKRIWEESSKQQQPPKKVDPNKKR